MSTKREYAAMRSMGRNKWKSRDGAIHLMADMDLGWLRNVVRMIKRAQKRYEDEEIAACGYGGSGDMAQMCADHAADQASRLAATAKNDAEFINEYIALREKHGLILEGPK